MIIDADGYFLSAAPAPSLPDHLKLTYNSKKWTLSGIKVILEQTSQQRRPWIKNEGPSVKHAHSAKCYTSHHRRLQPLHKHSSRRRYRCLSHAIQMTEASPIPTSILCKLFDIVLKCNVFSFNGRAYQQIQGMAMGTRMAPSYANLFMDRFERAFLAQEPIQPLVWKRYIDDILCIWTGSRSERQFSRQA